MVQIALLHPPKNFSREFNNLINLTGWLLIPISKSPQTSYSPPLFPKRWNGAALLYHVREIPKIAEKLPEKFKIT